LGIDLSINFDFFNNFLNLYSNPYPIIKSFFCILNNLIRNLQNTQAQNPYTQKIENPNPDLNLWVLLGAYVWLLPIYKMYIWFF